jgi:glycosyltransferase involved in cell wall biosynthesis
MLFGHYEKDDAGDTIVSRPPAVGTTVKVSVIVPVDRPGEAADRCIGALLGQTAPFELEIITAGAEIPLPADSRVRVVRVDDRNPAVRRNRAAAEAKGVILAFTDDDAIPETDWLERGVRLLESASDVIAVGGPDPAPEDSSVAELFSDTLLAAPWIGSGVLCHEGPAGLREIVSAHDIALVNLFVRKADFFRVGAFDETIGYIGEDSDLIGRLLRNGKILYSSGIVVRHRRRSFPLQYLRQRWRYRVKMGESLLASGSIYRSSRKLWLFLGGTSLFVFLLAVVPPAGIVLFLLYVVAALTAGVSVTKLAPVWWPLIPLAFIVHHATYFVGIAWGVIKGIFSRITAADRGAMAESDEPR